MLSRLMDFHNSLTLFAQDGARHESEE